MHRVGLACLICPLVVLEAAENSLMNTVRVFVDFRFVHSIVLKSIVS